MRILVLSLITAAFSLHPSLAQKGCGNYYPMKEGATFQYTHYDKKGKTVGISDHTVSEVSETAGTTTATMKLSNRDDKGKEVYTSSFRFTCSGNKVSIDYQSLLPEQMMEQMGDMEMEITGTDIEIPNNLNVGEALPDASVTMAMDMGGMKMKTTVNTINRKVEKKETVTTAAGSFECYVIYSDNQTQAMGINNTFPSRIWLADGVGMVKQENYKKNGELMSRTELTAFSQ